MAESIVFYKYDCRPNKDWTELGQNTENNQKLFSSIQMELWLGIRLSSLETIQTIDYRWQQIERPLN